MAVTARHVVSERNSGFKIFTKNTGFSGQNITAGKNIKDWKSTNK